VTISRKIAAPIRRRHHTMSDGSLVHEITPAETYQIDSDEYDSEAGIDDLGDEEYDRLVEEGGYRWAFVICAARARAQHP
jgi:NAD-dependent histone deacetylase SIR2